jgi:serine protease Do
MGSFRAIALAALLCSVSVGAATPSRLWVDARAKSVRSQRSSLSRIAKRSLPAVVSITTLQPAAPAEASGPEASAPEPQRGIGSGFIIHPEGYILTSSHVIEGALEIRIGVLGRDGSVREYPARVVGQDVPTDFAVLKIDAEKKLPVLKLGSARTVEVADWTVVIGNPFGLAHSVTVGVISYKGRTDVAPSGRTGYFDYLQTDASINPGNSGGPMLDLAGNVIGIANAVNVAGQGIGFGIPIDMAKQILPALVAHGKLDRGWMGISVQDLTPELAESFGLSPHRGVIISEVVEHGPADLAGLKVGDVIASLAHKPVRRAHALRWTVATTKAGRDVPLKVLRDGEPLELTVRLQALPESEAVAEVPSAPAVLPQSGELGAKVEDVDLQASLRAGDPMAYGALVRGVQAGGLLERAGVEEGDVILEVDGEDVGTKGDFLSHLEAARKDQMVRLLVRRGERNLFLAFRKP